MLGRLPIKFTKIKNNVYQAKIYGDAILNENQKDTGIVCDWHLIGAIIELEPQPNLSKVEYSSIVSTHKGDWVSDGYWKYEGYFTRYRFNQPRENSKTISLSALASPNYFGEIQRQHLVTVRLELRRK